MNKKLRILIPIVILVAVIAIFATHKEALDSFLKALSTADVLFVLFALVVLGGRYMMYSWAFKAGFRAIGADIKMSKMVEIVMSITFINDTAPTAGMAGSVYMAGWAVKKGASLGGAISLVFLDKITFFGSFALIQTVGLVVLAMNGQLSWILIAGSCVIYGLAIVFVLALYVSYKSPVAINSILVALVKVKNKIPFLKNKTSMEWASSTAASLQQAAETVSRSPKNVARMFVRMFLLFVCEFSSITFVSLSLGYTVITGIIAAYVAGFITSMLIVQTVGVIEAILVATLVAFGADFGTATAISLIYRGLLFWAPFGIGAICVQRTSQDFINNAQAEQDKLFGGASEKVGCSAATTLSDDEAIVVDGAFAGIEAVVHEGPADSHHADSSPADSYHTDSSPVDSRSTSSGSAK